MIGVGEGLLRGVKSGLGGEEGLLWNLAIGGLEGVRGVMRGTVVPGWGN